MKKIRDRLGRFIKGYKSWKDKRVKRECEVCGKTFLVHKYRAEGDNKRGRFCSRKCRGMFFRGKRLSPQTEFRVGRKGVSGENHPWWKGGIANERNKIRNANKRRFDKWREMVLIRNNYSCQKCGSKKDVMAHHISPVRKSTDGWFDVENGGTLCRGCHSKLEGGLRYD